MQDISQLDRKEKIFLAGCIKGMILSNGRFDEEELGSVDKIVDSYKFGDYESALNEFENEVDRRNEFWGMAQEIERPESREIILSVLNELSLKDGYRDREQESLIAELEQLWQSGTPD